MSRTLDEQETIIRFDAAFPDATFYTAHPPTARAWERLGLTLAVVSREGGIPTGWQATAPKAAVKVRRLSGGAVAKRRLAPGQGFQPKSRTAGRPLVE